MEQDIKIYQNAVDVIKTTILYSQARVVKAVNQEQLVLYYGMVDMCQPIPEKKLGQGTIEAISEQLRKEFAKSF